jgi:hypothetical protein
VGGALSAMAKSTAELRGGEQYGKRFSGAWESVSPVRFSRQYTARQRYVSAAVSNQYEL